jgi:hypothetical protein
VSGLESFVPSLIGQLGGANLGKMIIRLPAASASTCTGVAAAVATATKA